MVEHFPASDFQEHVAVLVSESSHAAIGGAWNGRWMTTIAPRDESARGSLGRGRPTWPRTQSWCPVCWK